MNNIKRVDYSPEEFNNLSTEERRLRGRLSTLKRMISKREGDIEELMKPILKKQEEIKNLVKEMDELKSSIKDMGFDFPTFRVEEFSLKGKYYLRGVWYVNSKKKQKYLCSTIKVRKTLNLKVDDEEKGMFSNELEKVLEHFLPSFQLDFWNKEYEDFKKQ